MRDEGSMGATSRRTPGGPTYPVAVAPSAGRARAPGLTTNDALVYLREVKQRFNHRKDVYDAFLDVMKDFKAQRIDIATVIRSVKDLLKGHNDLILGFNTFLPKGSEITMAPERREARPAVELDQAITYINRIKARFAHDERVYKNFLEILCCFRQGRMDIHRVYREVADLFRNHEDLLEEFGYFLPDHSQAVEPGGGQEIVSPPSRAMQQLSAQSHAALESSYPRRRSARQAVEGGAGRRMGTRDSLDYDREVRFFEEVRSRLNNREAYSDLLKCINLYAQDVISKSELLGLVQDLIGRHHDVMASFRQFITACPGGDDDMEVRPGGGGAVRGPLVFQRNRAGASQRNKYLTRPVSELDTSTLERPTTSYVRLPREYPTLKSSGKTALGEEVLQDELVSVTTGTEDAAFKQMRKNQYEENLFRCEDERFDLEMAIERNASAIRRLQPVHDSLEAMTPEEKSNFVTPEGLFSPIHNRIIEKIYGDQGKNVLDLLKKNPVVAIPVVLLRLQQKDQEWRQVKETMNANWQAVFHANYHKSLDHRSFYFKQADKKSLAQRVLLQEIKDAVEKGRKDDTRLQALSAACSLTSALTEHMSLEYPDEMVHEDVYQIVRFASSKMLSLDARRQVMRFWVQFVEPMFGLQPRQVDDHDSMASGEEEEDKEQAGEADEPSSRMMTDMDEEEREHGSGEVSAPLAPPREACSEQQVNDEEQARQSPEIGEAPPPEPGTEKDASDNGAEELMEVGKDLHGRQQDPSRLFGGCQPLTSIGHRCTDIKSETSSSMGDKQLLYCSEPFYLFFRLHHYLHQRLSMARKCCKSQDRASTPLHQGIEPDANAESGDADGAEKIRSMFMEMVFQLLDGNIEMSQFEDRCRTLLSTNSYVLFTLDKLIFRLVKQTQTLVMDDISLKIWELHEYEKSRAFSPTDELYHSNCRVILRDENCFRIEMGADRNLKITMMDSLCGESSAGILRPGFADYLRSFLGEAIVPGEEEDEGYAPVFLRRNLMPGEQSERLSECYVENGLECKLLCETSKLIYIQDTEDILIRKKRSKGAASVQDGQHRRQVAFQNWLDSKLPVLALQPPCGPPVAEQNGKAV
ncbi:unnamed protein product [Ostreobium quekettii]|uniref:Histone deacetylase interacting domain-containing protein n=1 Tax=Ostreobium quekettii TaxID=121088 RepID=A0A8S1IZR3_9CHLO|nr:unnamed protein product [Ostreobium quekettii]